MAEEELYEDVNISDINDDTDTYILDPEQLQTEVTDSESLNIIQNSEILVSEDQTIEVKRPATQKPETVRSTRLPIARIKNIMKMDPDINVISGEAVFLVTKATELFLETIAKETYNYMATTKRKTIAKKDFDNVIDKVDCLCFLEGAMDF